MTRFTYKASRRKIIALALSGAILTSGLVASIAQADSSYDSAYGHNKKADKEFKKANKHDKNRDGYDDRDTDRDGDVDNNDDYNYNNGNYNNGNGNYDDGSDYGNVSNAMTTRTGVVTRDLQGDRFEMRTDNGENFVVDVRGNSSLFLQNGTRVRVVGIRNKNRIVRASVQVLSNNDGNFQGRRVTLRGNVTRDLRGRRFEMRQNNVLYSIYLVRDEPNRLSVGDRVEVTGGLFKGNVVRADSLRIIRDNDNNNDGERINVDFPGRVLDVSGRRYLTVRGDNGTTYQVRTNFDFNSRISSGDRVRVVGTGYRNSRAVEASRIELRDDNNNNNNGDRVDFRGTVRSVKRPFFGDKTLVVEAENGRTWNVRVSRNSDWRSGDRVRVRGTIRDDKIVDAQVDRR